MDTFSLNDSCSFIKDDQVALLNMETAFSVLPYPLKYEIIVPTCVGLRILG